MPLSAKTRDKLTTVSTATIATTLYKRGLRIQMIQGMQPLTAFEDFVAEKVHEGRSILGLYPPTDPQTKVDFEGWRKAKGR